jgi:hypothetical protein
MDATVFLKRVKRNVYCPEERLYCPASRVHDLLWRSGAKDQGSRVGQDPEAPFVRCASTKLLGDTPNGRKHGIGFRLQSRLFLSLGGQTGNAELQGTKSICA